MFASDTGVEVQHVSASCVAAHVEVVQELMMAKQQTALVNNVSGVSTCRLLVLVFGQLAPGRRPGTLHEMQYWVRFVTLSRPATKLNLVRGPP